MKDIENIYNLKTDVLVIGSGGAGCRAAIEAYDAGASVVIVTKGILGQSGTTAFKVADTAGYNWADGEVDPADTPEVHFRDIVDAGLGMAYEELAWILAQEAPSTGFYLENLGVHFEKDPITGKYIEVKGCFASRPRMHILKGHGEKIIQALIREIQKRRIVVIKKTAVFHLLIKDAQCVGALGIDFEGAYFHFEAKSVVLACGGAGQLFKYTLTPKDITGDGYALGFLAGADLVNMEYMQVVLGIMHPKYTQFNTFLWCARPQLLDSKNEDLLKKYLPKDISAEECMEDKSKHFPFSTRDKSRYIEIAVQKEMISNPNNADKAVFIDLTKTTDDFVNALPQGNPLSKVWPLIKDYYKNHGVPMETQLIPIGCFAHAINGGLKIDGNGRTTIKGLYAAGEVAGGPHGADRLGGNMLASCQVFGARAGKAAAKDAANLTGLFNSPKKFITEKIKKIDKFWGQKGDIQPDEIKNKIKEIMWKGALVVRREETLESTIRTLAAIENDIQHVSIRNAYDIISVLESKHLLVVGLAICKAALHRKESRGSHYREDYPYINSFWNKRIILNYKEGEISIFEEPVSLSNGPGSNIEL